MPAPALHLVGDGSIADHPGASGSGWGAPLPAHLRPAVRLANHALPGHSSKSYLRAGHWHDILPRLRPDDWVVLQFGHNDRKTLAPHLHARPWTEYYSTLARYVGDIDSRGATPVLATPVQPLDYAHGSQLHNTLGDHADAMRRLAKDLAVPLIDLHDRTCELLETVGPARAAEFYRLPPRHAHDADEPRFTPKGARVLAAYFTREVREKIPDLAPWLQPPSLRILTSGP